MGIKKLEWEPTISSMVEKTEFSSPLDEMIADKMRASNMFFKHLDNPNGKKESYFPLPKRFSDKLENLPTHIKINVRECMRQIYRNGLDWTKEMAFHFLKDHGNNYPYQESVLSKKYTLKELYDSYWLRDMTYQRKEKITNLIFIIRLSFDSDKMTDDHKTIRLIVDIKCNIGVDGSVEYSVYNVTTELV